MSYDHPDWAVATLGAINKASRYEIRTTIDNNGDVEYYASLGTSDRVGKFFSRGCRGFLHSISVLCYNAVSSDRYINVYVAPFIGMGYLYVETITLPADASPSWREATFDVMWNYDSMFIWIAPSDVGPAIGYDTGKPSDGYTSSDGGVSWLHQNRRYHIKASLTAETPGDVPVSGTINAVIIPAKTSVRRQQVLDVPPITELYDTIQEGVGETLFILWRVISVTSRDYLTPRLRIDGDNVLPEWQTITEWRGHILGDGGTGFKFGVYDTTNDYYALMCTVNYPFRRSLEVGFYNTHTSTTLSGFVSYNYKKIV